MKSWITSAVMLACVQVVIPDPELLNLEVDPEHLQPNQCTVRVERAPLHADVKLHKEALEVFEWIP